MVYTAHLVALAATQTQYEIDSQVNLDPQVMEKEIYHLLSETYADKKATSFDKVEKLAGLLLKYPQELRPKKGKNKDMSQFCSEYHSHLLSYLMQQMKDMNSFTYQARDAEHAGLKPQDWLQDVAEDKEYSSYILHHSLKYALSAYGLTDHKSDHLIPFAQLFFAAYALKKRNHGKERASFLEKACLRNHQFELKKYLRQIADEKGIDLEDKLEGYLSRKAEEELMDLLQVSDKQHTHILALRDLTNPYPTAICLDENAEEECDLLAGSQKAKWESAQVSGQKNSDGLVATLKRVKAQGKKTLHKDVVALATLMAYPHLSKLDAQSHLEMMPLLNPDLLTFVQKTKIEIPSNCEDDNAVIYAAFTGLKYNTCRKRLKLAAAALANNGQDLA